MSHNSHTILNLMEKNSIFILAALMLLLYCEVEAQTNYLRQKETTFINVEYNLPMFKEAAFGKKTGWSVILNAKLKASDNLTVLLEVPYASGGNDYWGSPVSKTESDVTWGNPLIGLEIRNGDSDLYYEFGLRIPGTNKNSWRAISAGESIDLERMTAFFSESVSLYGLLDFKPELLNKFYLMINGGPIFFFHKEGGVPQTSLMFSNRFGFKNDLFNLTSGFELMVFLSGKNISLSERTTTQWDISVSVNFANFNPGLIFRLPLTGWNSSNGVIGFNLGYNF